MINLAKRRFSRRQIAGRGVVAGLSVPVLGSALVSHAGAQGTPQPVSTPVKVTNERTVIEPGKVLSAAVVANGIVYVSGQIPVDPQAGKIVATDIKGQTEQVMKNLERVLREAGSSFDRALKTTCFLTDLDNFGDFNEVYGSYFTAEPPARSTVQVSRLVMGALLEVDIIALAG